MTLLPDWHKKSARSQLRPSADRQELAIPESRIQGRGGVRYKKPQLKLGSKSWCNCSCARLLNLKKLVYRHVKLTTKVSEKGGTDILIPMRELHKNRSVVPGLMFGLAFQFEAELTELPACLIEVDGSPFRHRLCRTENETVLVGIEGVVCKSTA